MTEQATASAEIVTEVAQGQRAHAFHREWDMPMDMAGHLAINNQGDVPTVTFYLIETPGRNGWGLLDLRNIEKVFDDWEAGITDAPTARDKFTLFTPQWTRELDASTRSLTIETKDKEGVHPLVIKALAAPQQA